MKSRNKARWPQFVVGAVRRRPRGRSLSAALAVVLVVGAAATSTPGSAAQADPASAIAKTRSVPVKPLVTHYGTVKTPPAYQPKPANWPTGEALAGDVRISVRSRAAATAAGVNGVLLTAQPAARGAGRVRLSYAGYQDAFGGDWGSRLRLVQLPGCAITTPAVPSCRMQTPLPSTNDTAGRIVATDLSAAAPVAGAAPMVLAATSTASGGTGDFSATSLQRSGSWQGGGNGDAFTYAYPIAVPSVPGGLAPQISLAYDSQAQDGLTSATNNQASWIGDGWDYSPGFIERSYQSCHENPAGPTRTWDSCWSAKNTMTVSLNGTSSVLVKDDVSGLYHPQSDANEKVEYLPGADNGAQNGEHWRITTTDGTQYYFGKNKLPGWTGTSNPTTNSVWTAPVYATASNQPCYNATFANSWCQQAYRWNLDYVVDNHHDTISYFYKADTNYYARNLGTTANTSYVRGGYLTKIQYGQRDGQVYSTQPAGQVTFTANGRCSTSATGCAFSTLSSSTAVNWPDVPYDTNCASNASCSFQSPSFWTSAMLTGIQTQALVGTTESNVDSWTLSHSFPDTKDATTKPSLWLSSITRTGQSVSGGGSTTAITLPPTTFTSRPLSNRVNVRNGYSALTRQRMDTIVTETGETISVNYSTAVCASCAPSDPAQNTTLAYPVYWTPPGETAPILDWFNKYIVTHVTDQDPTGGPANDDITTTYTPVGTPAWHYNTDTLTATNRRTWDEWRGYGGMTVSTGAAPDPVTKTTYTYFRGMDGDYLSASSKRSVTVTDSRNEAGIKDLDQYAGMTYETQPFNGGTRVTDTITDPWTSAATATQSAANRNAYHVGTGRTRVFTALASGATRETETDDTHDGYGRVTSVSDLGDTATGTDDVCTTTSYADNTTATADKPGGWVLDRPSETRTVKVACGVAVAVPADVISDQQTYYDGSSTLGAAPTAGDVTMTKKVKSYSGSTPKYVTTSTVPDQYGRPVSATDAETHTVTTAYTPATGAAPTSTAVTDPLKLGSATTTYDSLRGLPRTTTDLAGYATTRQYDALGRLTAVYQPGRATSTTANIKYTYAVSNTGPSLVNQYTLNHDAGGYRQIETLYDSMLRARETQTQTAGTGRLISDVAYNTDGWKSEATDPYYNSAAISTVIEPAQAGVVDSTTGYLYDGAGRKTADIAYTLGDESWRTSYTYGGDFVTTVPPAGAPATTSASDARGHATTLREYHAGVTPDFVHAAAGSFDDTVYTYTPAGQLGTQQDAAKNSWSWTYDLLGEATAAKDPDAGTTSYTYDGNGAVLTVTDAESRQTTTSYDDDGRKLGLYDTTAGQTPSATDQLAAWTYDTVKKGLPASSTSYTAGDTFTDSVLAYNTYGTVTAHKVTLTGTDAALLPAAGYTVSYSYNANGTPSGINQQALGGLPNENLAYGYDGIDEPISLTSSLNAYVSAVGYDNLGQPLQYTLSAGATPGFVNLAYDQQTRGLTGITAKGFGKSGDIDNITYSYGNSAVSKGSGLVTRIVDKQDAATTTDTQCFGYDYATRLSQAWTALDGCSATPATGNSASVGGSVNPYWLSWTYDAAGNRSGQTDHATSGVSADDTTTAYHYPAQASDIDQPHTLTNTAATGPGAALGTGSYTYDKAGNTKTVTGGAHGNQNMTWTVTGKPATVATAAGTTTFGYDVVGSQLIQRDPKTTTLFLGDQQLVLDNTSKAVTGTRYYEINGATVATRTAGGVVTYLVPDRQGTSTTTINAASGAVTRRQFRPFGDPRGTTPATWQAGNLGYVGGTGDTNTGLVTLGARQYAPELGRFIAVDPILENGDPTQINGYAYAGNDPVGQSDPAGLSADFCATLTCAQQTAGGVGCTDCESGAIDAKYGASIDKRVLPHLNKKNLAKRAKQVDQQLAAASHPHSTGQDINQGVATAEVHGAAGLWGIVSHDDKDAKKLTDKWDDATKNAGFDMNSWSFKLGELYGNVAMLAVGGPEDVDLAAADLAEFGAADGSAIPQVLSGICSFDADTPVLMADGAAKPIKAIKAGDKVKATDPATSTTADKSVLKLHDNLDNDLADLTVRDGHGKPAVLHTTQNHLFWDATTKRWTRVDHLGMGDRLRSTGRAVVRVVSVRAFTRAQHMYNLTVADLHTYYVLAGRTPVLVHNEGCPRLWMDVDKMAHHYMSPNPLTGEMHATDWGMGGPFNKENAGRFVQIVQSFVKSSDTTVIRGTFRGQAAIHYVNPETGLHASFAADGPQAGKYLGGWKSPVGGDQYKFLMGQGVL